MSRCLPWKHVWIIATTFNGTQYKRCRQCGATKK